MPGDGIEVEGGVIGDEERLPDEGSGRGSMKAEPPSMALGEGEGGVHREAGVDTVDSVSTGQGGSEANEGAASGDLESKGFPDSGVDEEAKVAEESEDRDREGGGEGARETSTLLRHDELLAGGGKRVGLSANDGRCAEVSPPGH